jgi:hypothetical protein
MLELSSVIFLVIFGEVFCLFFSVVAFNLLLYYCGS